MQYAYVLLSVFEIHDLLYVLRAAGRCLLSYALHIQFPRHVKIDLLHVIAVVLLIISSNDSHRLELAARLGCHSKQLSCNKCAVLCF